MIVEYYLEDIKSSMKLFLSNLTKKIDGADLDRLIELSEESELIFGYFSPILKPNKYMIAALKHLKVFGAGSVNQIVKAGLKARLLSKKKSSDSNESLYSMVRVEVWYLKKLKIVKTVVLPYTRLNPTTIYYTSKCPDDQYADALEDYEKYRGNDRRPDKVIEYRHTKAVVPATGKRDIEASVEGQVCKICELTLDDHDNLKCPDPVWVYKLSEASTGAGGPMKR